MALQDIIKTLEQENQREIEKIEQQAAQKIKELGLEYDAKIKEEKELILQNARSAAKRQADMDLFAAKSKYKQEMLAKKKELLAEVYNQAISQLAKLSAADYEKLFAKLIKEIPKRPGKLAVCKERLDLTKQLVKKMKLDFQVEAADFASVGGFVWQSDSMNIDMTFEKLIEELKGQLEIELSQELFS